ncbi:conserved oligomeric Golgi complex subunit 7-like [Halichondria panicea]|uniref:conserved oligomeric Golgi complex subunit 7-like n=1 Tax=Halichondria panicea TaxID=6063 RepID=UPI00312B98B4
MDLSRFSDENFEVKEWVNGALNTHKDKQTSVDVHASTLVMKLQLFIQELNKSVEDTSMQMLNNLPRVLRDVESVRQEASLLNEQMMVVKEDIKRVESDTAHSMQTLVELDRVKQRMLLSQTALQEADNWTTLSENVEEVFATGDIQQIAEKLAGMQQSLNVLHDVPDYQDRKHVLEALKNRLEALVSPKLVAAFNSHTLDEARNYVQVFLDIERYSQLKGLYTGCHKASIHELWTEQQDNKRPLSGTVSCFYDELLTKWRKEFSWCSQVFPEPLPLLSVVFAQGLDSVPLGRCLATVEGQRDGLNMLIELRQASMRFTQGLEQALSSMEDLNGVFVFVEAVHSPYCQLLVKYPAMETQLLKHQLHALQVSSLEGVEETVSAITASVSQLFVITGHGLERCMQLTEGWGLPGLIRTLETLLTQYVAKVSSSMHQIRRGCGLEVGVASQGEEWTNLQHAFRLIQTCGDMHLRTLTLSSQLSSTVISCTTQLISVANETAPFGCYDYLSLYHPEEHTAVMELIAALQKVGGDYQLLPSSISQITGLNERAHTLAFDIIFAQLKDKLSKVPQLKVWRSEGGAPLDSPRGLTDDLPSFSLSPLPYITEIGDYLLTLPQQLEPFTSQDNHSLTHALKHGQLPFPATEMLNVSDDDDLHPSEDWLGAIARGTMETYVTNIFRIPSLTETSAHQLAADIAYLCNVLAALGQSPSEQMTQIEVLLKADREQFDEYRGKEDMSAKLYEDIRKLRTWI